MMFAEVRPMLSESTIEVGPWNKGFFTYLFLIPKKKRGKPLYGESEATEPIHNLHKVQGDHPETNEGSHLSRT